jgi:hypothetical protein
MHISHGGNLFGELISHFRFLTAQKKKFMCVAHATQQQAMSLLSSVMNQRLVFSLLAVKSVKFQTKLKLTPSEEPFVLIILNFRE